MRLCMLPLALLVACEKSASAPELGSPSAAARCQLAAIDAKDGDRWIACWHPSSRDAAKAELAKALREHADFWSRAKTRSAPLANVTDAQFTQTPLPADQADLGDQLASFRLDTDSFEAVRKDGRWYIADSGI